MGYRSTNTIIVNSAPIDVGPQAPGLGTSALGLAARGTPGKIAAQGGQSSLALSARLGAIRQVPQGGIATLGLGGLSTQSGVDASGSFTHVTITRDYKLATGEAPSGAVLFTPSDWLLNNKVTIAPVARPAPLDSEGRIRIDLAANNDIGTSPSNSHYVVLERIVGQPDRGYKVVVPFDAGTSVDLSTLPVIP